MCDERAIQKTVPPAQLTRRRFLQATAAAAGVALLPGATSAAPSGRPGAANPAGLVNPYSGSIPLVFPVAAGTYRKMWDTWHAQRQGAAYEWSHENGASRAHDGIDINPRPIRSLPTVYSAVSGNVVAVCWRADNSLNAQVTYVEDPTTPPPWRGYHLAADTVANLPLYGNFVWIRSTDPSSAGYFLFYCHLQNESTIRALAGQLAGGGPVAVGTDDAVGVMGDTGNAVGDPQLHVEIHYPAGQSFRCDRCPTDQDPLTAINPFRSLANATRR